MKKLLTLFASLLVLSSCGVSRKDNTKTISYSTYKEMIENKEDFVVFFGTKSCYGCHELRESLEEIKNEKDFQTWYYVNLSKLYRNTEITDELKEEFHQILPVHAYEDNGYDYNFLYTPTILKYVDGQLLYGRVGTISKANIELLESYNFIELSYYQSLFYLGEINLTVYDDRDEETNNKFLELYKENTVSSEKKYFIKSRYLLDSEKTLILQSYNKQNGTDLEELPKLVTLNYKDSLLY